MPRVALSEFRAKDLLYKTLGQTYTGLEIDLKSRKYKKAIKQLSDKDKFVTKVDQAVKKRNKLCLVKINRSKDQVLADLAEFAKQGYSHALVEPFIAHDQGKERYIALARSRRGVILSYSQKGGVAIESHSNTVKHSIFTESGFRASSNKTKLNNKLLKSLYDLFQQTHMTLLEINPCLIKGQTCIPLDAAVEVDSAAKFFVEGAWSDNDIRQAKGKYHISERAVEMLNAQSPASFNLKVLNPDGSYFLLLSGGGASVVVADELAENGRHADIANYGEYSGNPSEDETYAYTQQVLRLMLSSRSNKKVLLIAGGVANFTDVAKTFAGIIRALRETTDQLVEQNVTILVRRGGPNQTKGIQAIDQFLDKAGINHQVQGPEVSLASAVNLAITSTQ